MYIHVFVLQGSDPAARYAFNYLTEVKVILVVHIQCTCTCTCTCTYMQAMFTCACTYRHTLINTHQLESTNHSLQCLCLLIELVMYMYMFPSDY